MFSNKIDHDLSVNEKEKQINKYLLRYHLVLSNLNI